MVGNKMEYIKLLKILYLVDRRMLVDHGTLLTCDTWVSMDYGPVLSQTCDLIRHQKVREGSFWGNTLRPKKQWRF